MNAHLPTPQAVAAVLADHDVVDHPALPGRTNHLRAGVLVPLVWDPEPTCLMTLRPRSLRRHGGEICFPGGLPEDGDVDLQATALRETWEELGIRDALVLGQLCSMPLYTSDYRLVPYVAAVPNAPLVPSVDEVARVLREPIGDWLSRPWLEGIPYAAGEEEHFSPVFTLEDGLLLFGATAHTFYELLEVMGRAVGRSLPPMRVSALTWEEIARRVGIRFD